MTHEPRRPIIGVTGPDHGGAAAWLFTWFAITLAGGRAVRITPSHPCCIEKLDGLIIGGGADVDPKLYGQSLLSAELLHITEKSHPPDPDAPGNRLLNLVLFPLTWLVRKVVALAAHASPHAGQDAARDALEMRLIAAAVALRLPILGICRGCQLLNVHFGGTLHQQLAGLYIEDPEVRTILPRKRITIPSDTKLAKLIGPRPQRVNALHRQAINQIAPSLRVAASDRNGIIQAIEHESLPYVLGVQWHPEYLPQVGQQRSIFEALVSEAASARPIPVQTRQFDAKSHFART